LHIVSDKFCSRAIIRKGDSFIASRLTSKGTLLSLHDFQQPSVPILAAKFWFEGRQFVSGSDGFAVVPFTSHGKVSTIVASAPGGFACAKSIDFVSESWSATISIICPHESFVPGCTTSILLRCGLFLSSQRLHIPLSELQSPCVSLDALNEKGVIIQSVSSKVSFDDCCDLVLPWSYPTGCSVLKVTLTATVTPRCSVNGSMPISACASVSMPPSPSSYQPQSVAIIQAAAKRCDVIVPHLRLGNGKYWLDVSSTNEFCE
jgi:hypothetical protein